MRTYLLLLSLLPVALQSATTCPEFTEEDSKSVSESLRKRFVGELNQLTLLDSRDFGSACAQELLFRIDRNGVPTVFKIFVDSKRSFLFRDPIQLPLADAGNPEPTSTELANGLPGFSFGDAGAKHTLVSFIDFDCPFCKEQIRLLLEYENARRGSVRLVFRHLPLPSHVLAFATAKIAVCLVSRHPENGKRVLYRLAGVQQLDSHVESRFFGIDETSLKDIETCREDSASEKVIIEDMKLAAHLDLTRTPTLFADGHLITGPVSSFENLDKLLDLHEKDSISTRR